MTPETKAFVEQMEMACASGRASLFAVDGLPKALRIIREQDVEIERLRNIVTRASHYAGCDLEKLYNEP